MSEILERLILLVEPVLNQEGFELVDLTQHRLHSRWCLGFFLDKPGGISLDECAFWSEKIGDLIERENILDIPYDLEVSSPGVYRPLKKLSDFLKFIGKKVDIKLYAPLNGQKNFHGVLLDASDEWVRLNTDGKGDVEIGRSQIAKANLNPDLNF